MICLKHIHQFKEGCKDCDHEKEIFEQSVFRMKYGKQVSLLRNQLFVNCIEFYRRNNAFATYGSQIGRSTAYNTFENMLEPWQKMYVMNVFNNAGRL